MAGKIFLNYRRGDDAGTVGRLFDRLEDAFGKDAVFMDVEGHIKAGDDYVDVLRGQVAACDVLLAVIGPRWLAIADDTGRRRLDNPDDWVRVEIVSALEAGVGKRVIPVLVPRAEMPRVEDLPDDLKPLARKQAVRITLERFKSDAQGLVSQIQGVLADLARARAAASEAERAAAEAALRERAAEEARRATEADARARAQRLAGLSTEEIRKAEELANWEFVKGRDSIDGLRDHLARFPGGVSAKWAKTALAELVWSGFGAATPLAEVRAYVEEFGDGPHAAAARRKITEQEAAAKQRADDETRRAAETAAWAAAASGDKTAVDAFLTAWPDGEYAPAAKARLKELEQLEKEVRQAAEREAAERRRVNLAQSRGPIRTFGGRHSWQFWRSGHTGSVLAVAITPDGKTVISGSDDGTLKVWALAKGRHLKTVFPQGSWLRWIWSYVVGLSFRVRCVSVASYGDEVFYSGRFGSDLSEIRRLKIKTGHEIRMLGGDYAGSNNVLAVTHDNKTAVSGGIGSSLQIWDLEAGSQPRKLTGHTSLIDAVAITPDGKTVVSGSWDNTVKVWDLASGKELRTLTGHTKFVKAVAITPDGKTAVSGSNDDTLKVWDLALGHELRTLNTSPVTAVAITSDGRTVVSGDIYGRLHVWDFASGHELRTFTGHTEWVNAVAITPDDKTAVSGSADKTLKVWDISR